MSHKLDEMNAKDAWLKQVKHHRKRLKGLPRVGFNPSAGNVEHNINMFNKMNSPIAGPANNPISGPFGGDVGTPAGGISMGESFGFDHDYKLTPGLIKFLNKYEDLINANRFNELYKKSELGEWFLTAELTYALMLSGIDPLPYLDEVPYEYAQGLDISEITIPENISSISINAFCGCGILNDVTILDGCEIIEDSAFCDCYNLTEVTLPGTLKEIQYAAFQDCWSLENVYYNGSVEDWYKVKLYLPINRKAPFDKIHCLDGDAYIG